MWLLFLHMVRQRLHEMVISPLLPDLHPCPTPINKPTCIWCCPTPYKRDFLASTSLPAFRATSGSKSRPRGSPSLADQWCSSRGHACRSCSASSAIPAARGTWRNDARAETGGGGGICLAMACLEWVGRVGQMWLWNNSTLAP